jgi:cell division septation protein DedD
MDADESILARLPIARLAIGPGENSARVSPIAAAPGVLAAKTPSLVDQPAPPSISPRQWSVQVAAVPAKNIADSLAQQLNANGFDGYVLHAAVKGQAVFRVRVGHFASQKEAESLRQLLAGKEHFRSAYLAYD